MVTGNLKEAKKWATKYPWCGTAAHQPPGEGVSFCLTPGNTDEEKTCRAAHPRHMGQALCRQGLHQPEFMTLQQIADELNSNGVTTVRGRRFYPATIKMYLDRAIKPE